MPHSAPLTPGRQHRRHLLHQGASLQYLLFVPLGYDAGASDQGEEGKESEESEEKLPLILFLHGAGERGDDLDCVTRHGVPARVLHEPDFPFIAVSPQSPANSWWTDHLGLLDKLLDEVLAMRGVDPKRVYLTGMSMGGYGAWALAARNPERFAAVAPLCGGGDPRWAERLAALPIWAFHGADDPVVPLTQSLLMIDAVKRAGGAPRLTVYDGVGHDCWTTTYSDNGLYEWFREQGRSS